MEGAHHNMNFVENSMDITLIWAVIIVVLGVVVVRTAVIIVRQGYEYTLERFGPVRSVRPVHVFEIHFEGIQRSTRHKSGVALRFPRMARWRRDKPVSEANTLDDLRAMLAAYG